MKIKKRNLINSQVVLVGGGHSHVLFIKKFSMSKIANTELTLINPNPNLVYTGMVPGYIAGHYSLKEIKIDLLKLCEVAGVRYIEETVENVCEEKNEIFLSNKNIVGFDILSLDIGVKSKNEINFQSCFSTGIKPLNKFIENWNSYLKKLGSEIKLPNILIKGGGVGGIEIAMAISFRLKNMGFDKYNIMVVDNSKILNNLNNKSQKTIRKQLIIQKIKILENIEIDNEKNLNHHFQIQFNEFPNFVIFASGGTPHSWLEKSKLKLNNGFIIVDEYLRTKTSEKIFAVGDCINFEKKNLSKSGVYAVRQAPILYKNINFTLRKIPLKKFFPQKKVLKLVSLGQRSATWDRGYFSFSGKYIWNIKNYIDKKFMKKFFINVDEKELGFNQKIENSILCAGCAAKMGHESLEKVLQNLQQIRGKDILVGMGDDAAILNVDKKKLVFTTDHFRAFTSDFFLLSKIASIHSMNDIWAMGATPKIALANIILPDAKEKIQQNWLRELMNGATEMFSNENVSIVGGHTSIGEEFSIGFNVNGFCDKKPVTISGAKKGDILILTKPIGSGVLLAAKMQYLVDGEIISDLFSWMCKSQSKASKILSESNAMTDVTGFGLAGHLAKICQSSNVSASINLTKIPVYQKSMYFALKGVRSSLFEQNIKFSSNIIFNTKNNCDLLFDPQTSGGLLASVSEKKSNLIINELKKNKVFFSVIGKINEGNNTIYIND